MDTIDNGGKKINTCIFFQIVVHKGEMISNKSVGLWSYKDFNEWFPRMYMTQTKIDKILVLCLYFKSRKLLNEKFTK